MAEPLEPTSDETTETENRPVEQGNKPKTFNQQQVDDFIKARLDRANSSFKKERDAWETERTDLTTQMESLQSVVKESVINIMTKGMSPLEKEMFEALPFEKQLEMVQNKEFLGKLNSKTRTPVTPDATDKPEPAQTLPVGGRFRR